MPYARLRGLRVYYEPRGDPAAPALVLCRGLARSGRYWGELLDLLAPHFRLLVPDNRGVGLSDAPPPPYTTADMADDLAGVLDDAGVARAHVFGMSLGGMVAQRFALRHPARLSKLVLGCTSPGGPRAARYPVGAVGRLLLAGLLPPEAGTRAVAPYLLSAGALAERPEIAERWASLAVAEPPPLRGLVGQVAAAFRHDAWAELPRVSAPTLVLTGDADRLCPPRNSRLLAERLPRSELLTLPGAGHDFTADRPSKAAHELCRFLLRAPS